MHIYTYTYIHIYIYTHPYDCEKLFFKQWKFYHVENSTPLMGLEPTTPRLYVECSNRWAFQFMVWDTGSSDIDIFFVKMHVYNVTYIYDIYDICALRVPFKSHTDVHGSGQSPLWFRPICAMDKFIGAKLENIFELVWNDVYMMPCWSGKILHKCIIKSLI